jgi:hypothetical protein
VREHLSIAKWVPQGLLNFRPVQIGFQRCLGSATALSLERPSPFFVIPSAASGSAVRHSCAPLLPDHNIHESSRIILEKPTSPLSFRVSGSGPRNRRSLHGTPGQAGQVGFATPDFVLRLVAVVGR